MVWRRPHLTRTIVALGLVFVLWAAAALVGLRILGGPQIRRDLAAAVAGRLGAALGAPVRIGDLDFTVYPMRLLLRDVEVGQEQAPSLRVDLAAVSLGSLHLADRELVVSNLRLRGVWVDGTVPEGVRQGASSWFHVAVRQLEVSDVTVARLDLRDVTFSGGGVEVRWTGSRTRPVEAAVVHVGHFTVEGRGLEPVSGGVEARFRRTSVGWDLGRIKGAGPGWRVDGSGSSVGDRFRGRGTASVDLATLDSVVHAHAELHGAADATFEATLRGPDFTVDAHVTSERLSVVGFGFENVDGEARVTADGIEGSLVHASYAGGDLEGSYVLTDFGPSWGHRVALRGSAVDLVPFLADLSVPAAGLAARADLNADLAWDGHAIRRGRGTGVATLLPVTGDVPVSGRLRVVLAADGALQFDTDGMVLAGGAASWAGRLTLGDWIPNWSVRGEGVSAATVRRLLLGWVGAEILPTDLDGNMALDLRLRGPFHDLTVAGDVAVGPLALGPVDADGLEASFTVGQGRVEIHEASALIGEGRVDARGSVSYDSGRAVDLAVTGRNVDLQRAAAWLGVRAPLDGRIGVRGAVGGTIDVPAVESELTLSDVRIAGIGFGTGTATLALDDGVVEVSDLEVGSLRASAVVGLAARTAEVHGSVRSLGLEPISAPLARIAGSALDLEFSGVFPFDRPSGVLQVMSSAGASGRLDLSEDGFGFDLVRPEVWRLSGRLSRSQAGFDGRFEFAVPQLGTVLEDALAADVPVVGRAAGDGRIVLASEAPARIDGRIAALSIEVEGEHGELESPAVFTVVGNAVSVENLRLRGQGTTFAASAGRAEDGAFFGTFSGQLPGVLFGILVPELNPRGRVEVDGVLTGSGDQPRFEGTARVEGGSVTVPGLSVPLTRISGELEFVPEAIRLEAVDFAYGSGRGVCDGRIFIAPEPELDLAVTVDRLRWPLAAGLVPVLDGSLRLAGPLTALSLSGDLTLLRTTYRRDVNLQRLVLEELMAPERAAISEENALLLNIRVAVPGTLDINAPLARLTAQGELRVVGSSDQPGVLGRLEALPGGEVDLSGNRFELDRATVTFSNPGRIDPFLDVVGRTIVDSTEITIALVGTLDHLTPTFTSNPPLPEMDIISFLSTGRRADEAGQLQAGALASSFLAEQLTGEVTRQARTLLDVDQLRVDPFLAQSENPTARVTVVKQLSRDWTVTLSTNLASNREEVVVSRWRLGQGFYLEANRDTDGSYGLEVKWQQRY